MTSRRIDTQAVKASVTSFNRMWIATFVAAGTYGIAWGALMVLLIGGTVFGAATIDVLWSSVVGILAFIVLGVLSVFIVPLLTRSLVKSIARARVGLVWTCVSVLVGWVLVTALSSLLWLIPGAQPFAALLVWAGATAVTAYLLLKRSTPLNTTVASTAFVDTKASVEVDPLQAAPHQH